MQCADIIACSLVTGCKKFIGLRDRSPESRASALIMIRHWCNMAGNFKYQRQHVGFHPTLINTPAAAVVAAQQYNAPLPARVATDAELDAEAAMERGRWSTVAESGSRKAQIKLPV